MKALVLAAGMAVLARPSTNIDDRRAHDWTTGLSRLDLVVLALLEHSLFDAQDESPLAIAAGIKDIGRWPISTSRGPSS